MVSLCAYNERENLEQLIPEIRSVVPDADIVVIDDNSPDGTGDVVRTLAARDTRVHLVSRPGKLGLGTATIEAFRFAAAGGYDWLLNLDADYSHPPRFIPSLLEATWRADVVIGSRYVPGGKIPDWPFQRRLMSWGINTLARICLGLKTHDNSGAFRCYRMSKASQLVDARIIAKGYAFQEEVLYRLKRLGCTFVEVPITFEERRFGRTKINLKEIVAAFAVLGRLGLSRLIPRGPR
ncbi:MAG TPA: polyprenol monophosphomannose synthase [Caulifigura sp.]|nr:polyprenol monophosphomannose synthase [Caulifigura sp.]